MQPLQYAALKSKASLLSKVPLYTPLSDIDLYIHGMVIFYFLLVQ